MPTYTYRCGDCGSEIVAVRKIADRHIGPQCCGDVAKLTITPTNFAAPKWNMSYYCQGLGKPITSERQRKYEMDKAGVVDYREYREDPNLKELPNAPKASVPDDLRDAMKRENLSHMLDS